MKTWLKTSSVISLLLGVISFGWLIYDIVLIGHIKSKLMAFDQLDGSTMIVKIGFLITFIFYISAVMTIFSRYHYFKKADMLGKGALIFGFISIVVLFGTYRQLGIIWNQYQTGLPISGEWHSLFITMLLPHGIFHLLMFIVIFETFHAFRIQDTPEIVLKDEIIFRTAQYVGIGCGIFGLIKTFASLLSQVSPSVLINILPYQITFFLMPYGLVVSYWLVMKFQDKRFDWYDEKQWQDVMKGGLTALVLSVPGMVIMFFFSCLNISGTPSILWFPYYLFMILLLFSGSILYYSGGVEIHKKM